MQPAFVDVLACAWGTTRFSFAADGRLIEVSIRSGEQPGQRGRRPAGAPSKAALKAWLRDYEQGGGAPFPGPWDVPGASAFRQAVYRAVAAIHRVWSWLLRPRHVGSRLRFGPPRTTQQPPQLSNTGHCVLGRWAHLV